MRVTRGAGFLEGLLARLRCRQANKLISPDLRSGRLLDIGCGSYPLTLTSTPFREKYGLDREVQESQVSEFASFGIELRRHDIELEERLPFDDATMDVITILAVVEHLDRPILQRLCREAHRVLRPGGQLIATTPASWTGPILTFLARIGMLSQEEIEEHRDLLTRGEMEANLRASGFPQVRSGLFELGLNSWFLALRYNAS